MTTTTMNLTGDGGRSEEKRCYAVNSKWDGGKSEEKRRYVVN